MDSELLYLNKRVNFHRRMARQAVCREARCAHNAFVSAYLTRMADLTRKPLPASPEAKPGLNQAHRPTLLIAGA